MGERKTSQFGQVELRCLLDMWKQDSDCTGRTVNTQEVEEEEGPRAWRGEGEPVLLIDILVFNLQMLLRLCLLSH